MAEAEINSSKRSFHGEWPRLDLFFLYINKKILFLNKLEEMNFFRLTIDFF